MASIVSFQIEVICIFSKRGVYKLVFEDFIHSNCFFVTISLLRGYFCKIMCNGQQAELNFNLLKSTKMEPLEVLVVLEVSKYGFYILRALTAISQTFIREQLFTFSCLDFPQTVIYLYNSFRAASVTPAFQRAALAVTCPVSGDGLYKTVVCRPLYIGESFHSLSHRTIHAVGFFIIIKVGRQKRVISEVPFLFLMEIIVLYKGFNAMSESIQVVLFASVSGIADRYVRVSAVKGMEIIHMLRIGGGIIRTLVDGIVQNELLVGTDLWVISGFKLPISHVVLFHAHESCVFVRL